MVTTDRIVTKIIQGDKIIEVRDGILLNNAFFGVKKNV